MEDNLQELGAAIVRDRGAEVTCHEPGNNDDDAIKSEMVLIFISPKTFLRWHRWSLQAGQPYPGLKI